MMLSHMAAKLNLGLLGALSLACLALGGCTVNTGSTSPGSGSAGAGNASGGPGSSAAAARKQACGDVMSCVVACAKGDTACEDACVEGGSTSAQAKFEALDDCLEASACQDDACVRAECDSQITACTEDVAPDDPNDTTSGGPFSLVGAWESLDVAAGRATSFTFNADGTYRKTFVFIDPSPTCTYFKKRTIVDDGRATIAGDSLTVVPSETLQTMISCADTESGSKTMSLDDTYEFAIAGSTLTLTDTTNGQVTIFARK